MMVDVLWGLDSVPDYLADENLFLLRLRRHHRLLLRTVGETGETDRLAGLAASLR